MKNLLLLLGIAIASAQDVKLPADQERDVKILILNKTLIAKDDEISKLQAEIRQLKLQALGVEEHTLVKTICDAQKLALEKCKINPDTMTVSRIPDSPTQPTDKKKAGAQ